MHTADIAPGVSAFPLNVTYNAVDPAQSVNEQYTTPGNFTGSDSALAWASVNCQGTLVNLGQTVDIPVGSETLRTTAELELGDPKHIRIRMVRIKF